MSFWRTYYHLVWATKNRNPLIDDKLEPRLFRYLISKTKELEVTIYAIGGWTGHIHLVVSIPPKLSVSDVVKRLKGASAHYLNEGNRQEPKFGWQRGYGVLTLGERQRAKAETYVRRQKEHHRQQTTNAWLERVDQFDDGPTDKGLSADPAKSMLRETEADYELPIDISEIPF